MLWWCGVYCAVEGVRECMCHGMVVYEHLLRLQPLGTVSRTGSVLTSSLHNGCKLYKLSSILRKPPSHQHTNPHGAHKGTLVTTRTQPKTRTQLHRQHLKPTHVPSHPPTITYTQRWHQHQYPTIPPNNRCVTRPQSSIDHNQRQCEHPVTCTSACTPSHDTHTSYKTYKSILMRLL